jgi:hypothetical protein
MPATDEYFYKIKRTNKKLGEHYVLSSWCKQCYISKSLKNYENNKEHGKEVRKEWKRKNRISEGEKDRKWYRENKKHRQEYFKTYQKLNKNYFNEYTKLRASKNHIISNQEWTSCKQYFNSSCAYCGLTETEHKLIHNKQLHREHVDPNGANDLSNCVPSCQSCNSEKHIYSFDDWYNNSNQKFSQERKEKIIKWLKEDYLKFYERNMD